VGVADLCKNYHSWCRTHHLQPFGSTQFTKIAKTELENSIGLKYSHDLKYEGGGCMRGWKGLAVVEDDEAGVVENASVGSG